MEHPTLGTQTLNFLKRTLEMESEQSRLPFVHRRAGHVAVTWKEITIIWGGCEYGGGDNEYWDPAEVTFHFEVCSFVIQYICSSLNETF